MEKRKIAASAAAAVLFLTACSSQNDSMSGTEDISAANGNSGAEETVTIRFLNSDPAVSAVYEELAAAYHDETGNTLIIETAEGDYDEALRSKMTTAEMPVIFTVRGMADYGKWRNSCIDLSDTDAFSHLIDKELALSSNDIPYGIPYHLEGYGIVYNDKIMERYFALENKATDFVSMDEIDSFDELRLLVEDMQANSEALGINGVFAPLPLGSADETGWAAQLINIPLYYEFKENDIDLSGNGDIPLDFDYSGNLMNILDLYLDNSTTDRERAADITAEEALSEFAGSECAMIQGSSSLWRQLRDISANTVFAEDLEMLPIYIGIEDEDEQGLCIGADYYLCINASSSPEERKAAEDFISRLYTSDTMKDIMINKAGFTSPFDTVHDDEMPSDPLSMEVLRRAGAEDTENVPRIFVSFPKSRFTDDVRAAILDYAKGSTDRNGFRERVISLWG